MLLTLRAALALIAFGILCACQSTSPSQQSATERRIATTETEIATCITDTCERLNIDRGHLSDFSVLGDLTHVTALRMSWTDFADLNDITAMNQLRELHISSTQISDLSALSAFPDLDILHLQWSSQVEDFSPITQIPSLKELALGGNNMGDMAFVAQLRDLDGLSLIDGSVTSLEALRDHPTLSRLDVRGADLPDDFSALLTMPNLKMVSISVGSRTETQKQVIDELKARGVVVEEILDAVVVIC